MSDMDLFEYARTVARTADPIESHTAAAKVARKAERSQRLVREALRALGQATDEQIHARIALNDDLSEARVRTARSELVKQKAVVKVGQGVTRRGGACGLWALADAKTEAA